MRYLLDENLDARTAAALTIASEADDEFGHILAVTHAGEDDENIPSLCQRENYGALITVNVKDFGAKKLIYEALIAAGIHVIVVRPGKVKLKIPMQVSLITHAYARIRALLADATKPMFIRVTPGGTADPRSIEELEAEFAAGDRRPLP